MNTEAGRLLAHLHRGGGWAYWWGVTGEEKVSRWWPVGKPAPLPTAEHVYFGVHPATAIPQRGDPAKARATIPDLAAVNCLFAEFDAKDQVDESELDPGELARILADVQAKSSQLSAAKARVVALENARKLTIQRNPAPYMARSLAHIDGLAVAPAVIVDSGGGYHCYWLLRAPFVLASNDDRERARRLQAAWVAYVGGDTAAKDLARVLRVPGSVNRKYDPPRPVAILHADYDQLYNLPDLETLSRPPERPTAAPIGGNGRGPSEDAGAFWLAKALDQAAPGNRNATGFWLATQLRDAGLSASDAEGQLLAYARLVPQGEDYYSEAEALASLREAYKTPAREPARKVGQSGQAASSAAAVKAAPADEPPAWLGGETNSTAPTGRPSDMEDEPPTSSMAEHLTDLGNARRLVARHGAELQYCHPWGKWLVWDGKRWTMDNTAEAVRHAKETVRAMYAEAAGTADEETRKALGKHALKCEAIGRITAMLDLANSEPSIPVLPDRLDMDPWALNVLNGTVDLRTGQLREHRRQDLVTKLAPVVYDPDAACPTWERFLLEVMNGDQDLIGFLQRAIGYTLTGDTSEQVLFILHGKGANGKSTLLETLRAMLGDEYTIQIRPETLMIRQGDAIPNDVARLKGARLVNARETEEGKRLAEGLVKEMTGGDTITARFLRQEFFDFRPEFKLFLAANHKPTIRGTDLAIWRRIRLIPFAVTFPEDKQDKQLAKKLQAELPGILAWAVRGCQEWQNRGLGIAAAVKQATEAYRSESDILAAFLDECTFIDDNSETQAKPLYDAYKTWCDEGGEKWEKQTMFGRRLKERLDWRIDKRTKVTFYLGIRLAEPEKPVA